MVKLLSWHPMGTSSANAPVLVAKTVMLTNTDMMVLMIFSFSTRMKVVLADDLSG